MAQIQEFGRAMGEIMAKFLQLKSTVGTVEASQSARETLKDELDIDVSAYLDLDDKAFEKYFKEKSLHPAQLEKLIEYHMLIGETLIIHNKKVSQHHLGKALLLYQWIEKQNGIFSFDRIYKEQKIRELLEQ